MKGQCKASKDSREKARKFRAGPAVAIMLFLHSNLAEIKTALDAIRANCYLSRCSGVHTVLRWRKAEPDELDPVSTGVSRADLFPDGS